jgi:cyclohexanecarboxylate-CoA ligase
VTLDELMAAAPRSDGPVLVDRDHALTRDDLDAAVASAAADLVDRGVGRGDRVAWQLPNCVDAVIWTRACWRIGAIAAPLHHLAGASEIEHHLAVLDPTAILGPPPPKSSDSCRSGGIAAISARRVAGEGGSPEDDLAVVLFTSGSTGSAKAVLHTHRALVYKSQLMCDVHTLGPTDAALVPSPIAHISGMLNAILVPGAAGMRVVLMEKWEPGRALDLIEEHQITFMIGPPTQFIGLMDHRAFTPERVASMRVISTGAMGVSPSFVERASDAFGAHVKRAYGSTEAPTVTTCHADDPPERSATSDGRAIGDAEVRIVDGEVWVRGPELFAGYADPAQTAEVMRDGWFRTGDLGVLDDGRWLRITGRVKDLIIRAGENIAPAEVEAVLELHPSVAQAVAVGYPDDTYGERVAAFVVLATTAEPAADAAGGSGVFDVAACREWFAEQGVARFKTPERVIVLDELPVLGIGKPDRARLRRLAADLSTG